LKLTTKLNPILEIESFVISQFILRTLTHFPKIFLQTQVFDEIPKFGYFLPEKIEDRFWLHLWPSSWIIWQGKMWN